MNENKTMEDSKEEALKIRENTKHTQENFRAMSAEDRSKTENFYFGSEIYNLSVGDFEKVKQDSVNLILASESQSREIQVKSFNSLKEKGYPEEKLGDLGKKLDSSYEEYTKTIAGRIDDIKNIQLKREEKITANSVENSEHPEVKIHQEERAEFKEKLADMFNKMDNSENTDLFYQRLDGVLDQASKNKDSDTLIYLRHLSSERMNSLKESNNEEEINKLYSFNKKLQSFEEQIK
ncbi:MAG: hypothetical protein NT068_01785 [Candidatus Nomurabacteria bacterium]|nr:hypothetical protein [Candidatus Nomurabacteria bacterium]